MWAFSIYGISSFSKIRRNVCVLFLGSQLRASRENAKVIKKEMEIYVLQLLYPTVVLQEPKQKLYSFKIA